MNSSMEDLQQQVNQLTQRVERLEKQRRDDIIDDAFRKMRELGCGNTAIFNYGCEVYGVPIKPIEPYRPLAHREPRRP